MNIALIGGAGYVGRVLNEALLQRGHWVTVFDNLMYGQKFEPKHGRKEDFCFGSICSIKPYHFTQIRQMDAVVNLAGISNDPCSQTNPCLAWEANSALAARIAWAAEQAGVKRLIYSSSASVYHSEKSEIDAELTELFPVHPRWHYSASKYAGELACQSFEKIAVCILRKGTICGPSPRMRWDLLLNTMFKTAITSGKITLHGGGWVYRPLLGIDDAVRAYVQVIEAPIEKIRGRVFNVSSSNATVREYATWLTTMLKIDLVDGPPPEIVRSYKISSRSIQETLGWYPQQSAVSIYKDLINYRKGLLYPFQDFDDPTTENLRAFK